MIMYNAEGVEATVLPEQIEPMLATGWSKTPPKKEAVPTPVEAETEQADTGEKEADQQEPVETDTPRKITIKKKSN